MPGFRFISWNGTISGTDVPLVVQITNDLQVGALFQRNLTAFEQWQTNQFTDLTLASPNDDPDNDGIANLIEYVQGTDPSDSTSHATSLIRKASDTQIELVIPFTIDDPEITWVVEQSSNLNAWSVLTPQDATQTDTNLQLRIERPMSQIYLRVRFLLARIP